MIKTGQQRAQPGASWRPGLSSRDLSIEHIWITRLSESQRALVAQTARFAVSGAMSTLLTASLYTICATLLGIHPLLSNAIAYMVGVTVGYALHSRWSFRGYGTRKLTRTGGRFLAVCFISFCINSAWIWVLTQQLRLPVWTSLVPMIGFTPAVSFILNRCWTFARMRDEFRSGYR